MDGNGQDHRDALCGYRLSRLEVFNWGTFDGKVHSLLLAGETTLLVGQNGAGKSTLVDALLSLLVRPNKSRQFNLAAGAKASERTERSYILGAFDRRSQEDSNRSATQYLRPVGAAAYSILLACFANPKGDSFTVAQILFLSDSEVEKWYCFSDKERSIASDISGLKGMDRMQKEMKRRGFEATKSYTEYFSWFRKTTGVKEQAMDIFNQTVAVKDIHRLNEFIRKHMLETKPWNEKVEELFKHFKDLSDAHGELERVRRQRELLEPVERFGLEFRTQADHLEGAENLLAAADSYFPTKIIEVFEPEIAIRTAELGEVQEAQRRLKSEIDGKQDECRVLKNELASAGGERMAQIPHLIRNQQLEAATKKTTATRMAEAAGEIGLPTCIVKIAEFESLKEKLAPMRTKLEAEISLADQERVALQGSRIEPERLQREAKAELEMLEKRKGNLPPEYVLMRRQLCDALKMVESDLPFAAEMIAVKPTERDWESSIETALRPFALSLLVPQRFYPIVSHKIEGMKLRDSRGYGQKLDYFRIAERERRLEGPRSGPSSLFRKLDFREGTILLPWVKAELQERHDIRCCDTIEEFQQTTERAMTRNRHQKFNASRHVKDDRDRVADPRHFVLGWDNKEKKRRLAQEIETLAQQLAQIDSRGGKLSESVGRLQKQLRAIEIVEEVRNFDDIDYFKHEQAVADLHLELKALEEGDSRIQEIKKSLAACEHQLGGLLVSQRQSIRREQQLESDIASGATIIGNQRPILAKNKADGSFARHAGHFDALDRRFADDPLTMGNFSQHPENFRRGQHAEVRRLQEEIKPLRDSVTKAMGKYLNANEHERNDLNVALEYLPDFLKRLERIRAEDLPRFESRFKERLNEKVGQEIGILRGNLNTEKSAIDDRIQILNESLRQVAFSGRSHMQLIAKPVRDPEIAKFRQELDACISGQFEGTLEADEARFKQIESLIEMLRSNDTWRMKVTDVRNWFDFAARETDDATGAELSYHDDSAGQSGGEKAKLAFTILIAAIAFQYDLEPERAVSDRFHFVVVDEMFSRIDDANSAYALDLFKKFGLQLLIVAPFDAKARVTENHVGCYLHVWKDDDTNRSQVLRMTAREFLEQVPESELKRCKPR